VKRGRRWVISGRDLNDADAVVGDDHTAPRYILRQRVTTPIPGSGSN